MKWKTLFSDGKTNRFIESVDRLLGTVDHSVLLFKEGVQNYLYDDKEGFAGNLATMASLESEAGALRREIESSLYSRGVMIRYRGDIMRLLERFDHILSIISNDLIQFEIEAPNIPQDLRKEFVKLTELATMAVESTIPGTKAYFTEPDKVSETTNRVYFYEKEAVKHLCMMPHLERAIFPWQNAWYPAARRQDEVTPWIEAFVNARKWVESQAR